MTKPTAMMYTLVRDELWLTVGAVLRGRVHYVLRDHVRSRLWGPIRELTWTRTSLPMQGYLQVPQWPSITLAPRLRGRAP